MNLYVNIRCPGGRSFILPMSEYPWIYKLESGCQQILATVVQSCMVWILISYIYAPFTNCGWNLAENSRNIYLCPFFSLFEPALRFLASWQINHADLLKIFECIPQLCMFCKNTKTLPMNDVVNDVCVCLNAALWGTNSSLC
jgi:hypothetical protein